MSATAHGGYEVPIRTVHDFLVFRRWRNTRRGWVKNGWCFTSATEAKVVESAFGGAVPLRRMATVEQIEIMKAAIARPSSKPAPVKKQPRPPLNALTACRIEIRRCKNPRCGRHYVYAITPCCVGCRRHHAVSYCSPTCRNLHRRILAAWEDKQRAAQRLAAKVPA